MQYVRGTRFAKRTLERTDSGVERFGWQVAITAFAAGTEFEHRRAFLNHNRRDAVDFIERDFPLAQSE